MIKLITCLLLLSTTAFADSKGSIVSKIRTVAATNGLDPDFAIAIATVESGLNPEAVGALGEVGLFQLRPEYHDVKPGNTSHNIKVAVLYLAHLKQRWGSKYPDSWFVLYNYGPGNAPKAPTKTEYYKKVMLELGKIKFSRYVASK